MPISLISETLASKTRSPCCRSFVIRGEQRMKFTNDCKGIPSNLSFSLMAIFLEFPTYLLGHKFHLPAINSCFVITEEKSVQVFPAMIFSMASMCFWKIAKRFLLPSIACLHRSSKCCQAFFQIAVFRFLWIIFPFLFPDWSKSFVQPGHF